MQQSYVYCDCAVSPGTMRILCKYFDEGIFSSDTIVLLYYRYYSSWYHHRLLDKHHIKYRYIRNISEFDKIESGTVFYLFNNLSNARLVANRRLKHIFATHGESNKITSVKPIIRIYDEVCVAGQAGIDRYLSTGLFSQHDVDTGRIRIMGDKFIGKTGLSQTGQEVILYAPTWEGVIARQENYSSLPFVSQVVENIIQAVRKTNINTVLIKIHPNTGTKNRKYINYLMDITRRLKQQNIEILLYGVYSGLFFWEKSKFKKIATWVEYLSSYCARMAFCDISAMETQLLNENIPYYIFSAEKNKGVKCLDFVHSDNPYSRYYQNAKIVLSENTAELKDIQQDDFVKLKEYVISSNVDINFFKDRFK